MKINDNLNQCFNEVFRCLNWFNLATELYNLNENSLIKKLVVIIIFIFIIVDDKGSLLIIILRLRKLNIFIDI